MLIYKMNNIPEKLLNLGEKKYFKKNEIIIHQGDVLNYIYILLKGKILGFGNSNDGSILYDSLIVPPCIIGESHTIHKKVIPSSFKCLDNSEVVMISRDNLINIMKSDFDITIYLYNATTTKFDYSTIQAFNNATFPSEKRIINFLTDLVNEIGIHIDDKIKIDLEISQQFISNFVGVDRVTVYRTFDKLKNENILDYYDGYYFVNNIELLNSYS